MKLSARLIILLTLALPIVSAVCISACDEEDDCTLATRAMVYCNLYRLNDAGTAYIADTLDVLTVKALGTDSTIVNAQEDVSDLTLPLRYTSETTTLVFHYYETDDEDSTYLSGVRDTLWIFHTNTPYFLSMDCGYQMKQYIESVTYSRHQLDSISLTDEEANIYGTENLRLYFQ